MNNNPDRITQALTQARLNLVLDAPFFGTLAFKLLTKPDPTIPTTHVDGQTIRYNPDYIGQLTDPQLAGQLVENILHCAQGHLWRRNSRDLQRWNSAADQTAWEILSKLQSASDGRITMPPNGHCRPDLANLSTEEVYHLLESEDQQAQQNGQPPPPKYQSPGSFDQPAPDPQPPINPSDPSDGSDPSDPADPNGDGDGPSGEEAAPSPTPPQNLDPPSLQDEWKDAVTQAATIEKQRLQGNLPAWIKQLIDDLVEPRVPWTDLVREFCHRLSRDDYSFRRPNRRFLQHGFILPSLQSETLGPIVGAFDTSGSIFCHPPLVQAILSEFQAVLDLCKPEKMLLIDCDTTIHQQLEYFPGDDLRAFTPQGGGGTDFRPIFQAIQDLPEPPACLIFLTDLWGSFPDSPPDFPVLWANFGDPREKAPFGTTIHVPIES